MTNLLNDKTIQLALDLISRSSVTPEDKGCQPLMTERLKKLGFEIENLRFAEVDNFWARKNSTSKSASDSSNAPFLVFAGHTDVVPTGPTEQWQVHPFKPEIIDGILYGRGSADMKGSLACMIVACENFIAQHPDHKGSIGFLITSDEEGPSINGTVKVVQHLEARNEKIDMCLVGEPSSTHRLGDVVKNGRRGSLSGNLTILGKQGHVAYPHLADNPIHRCSAAITELVAEEWDQGNEFFPATSFQISNINAGTGANNVIPGECEILFNLRFSTEVTEAQLKLRVEAILDKHNLKYNLVWNLSGQPFLTAKGELVQATCKAIKEICGITTELSTAGGTSDGRFIAPTGAQVLELGPLNATIHQLNEHVKADDLITLTKIYQRMMEHLLL